MHSDTQNKLACGLVLYINTKSLLTGNTEITSTEIRKELNHLETLARLRHLHSNYKKLCLHLREFIALLES